MQNSDFFTDIVIMGGGPTGLLLATKLGSHLSVRVIERNQLGQTSKFWLTSEERLIRHDLSAATQYRTRRATLGTFQGSFAYAEGDFAVINDKILLGLLLERCQRSDVRLMQNTKVLSIAKNNQQLLVHTTGGTYHTRMVLDASGGGSPFAATFRLHRLEGFYSIYGGHLQNLTLRNDDIVGAHILHFGHPAPIFEVIPTSPTSAFCIIFIIDKNVVATKALRESFDEHVKHNPFFIANNYDPQTIDLKMGLIPIGRMSGKRIPGIVPVGEAGLLQSPLLGAALNEVLEQGDRITKCIVNAFRTQRKEIISLQLEMPLAKVVNDRLQLLLVRPLLDGTLKSFEKFVEFLKEVGPERSYRLFGTQIHWTDAPLVGKAAVRYWLKV